ncbi:Rpn family recombination-promoting nuclease/putative transposase [Treponema sp. OMZ 840]|uniref:Rpn family recombination-promoting nuclease/putative transposase n=1 Tax=Treponema sp. OMZ 840 TaxID=244313 RepID=UPI003D8B0452
MSYAFKNVDELTFTDDFMFGTIMKNPEICKGVIERLLYIKVGKIEYPSLQKTIAPFYESKGIRLDVYAADDERTFDIEMQTSMPPALAKRTRYYQSLMDVDNLLAGHGYDELKESYVMFICLTDPFKQGLPVYTFRNTCSEQEGLFLDDKSYKVFYNASAYDREENTELHAFLEYLCQKRATSDFTKNIDELVETAKLNEQFRSTYMSLNIREYDLRREGRIEGEAIGFDRGRKDGFTQGARQTKLETAKLMKGMNYPISDICTISGLSKEEIEKL